MCKFCLELPHFSHPKTFSVNLEAKAAQFTFLVLSIYIAMYDRTANKKSPQYCYQGILKMSLVV